MRAELEHFDVVIAGGGPVGAALALALRETPGLSVRLVTPPGSGRYALRPVAIAAPSERLLSRLGVFEPAEATAIRTIHVSQRGSFGRTVIRAEEHGLAALGYVVDLQGLASRMLAKVGAEHISGEMVRRERLADRAGVAEPGGVRGIHGIRTTGIELADPDKVMRTLTAGLLVLADGAPDPAVTALHGYEQTGVVATVAPAQPHDNVAWERFTPEGPLALLPFGARYAVVWSVNPARAPALAAADDAAFCAALSDAFGGARPQFHSPSPRVTYPLTLRRTRAPIEAGVVAIGNAAQTLHPVAGQGLNLGLRDVESLATRIRDLIREGHRDELGEIEFARAFAASRAFDRGATIAATDLLARIFTTDRTPIALARGFGLTILDLVPPLRGLLARRMMLGHRGLP